MSYRAYGGSSYGAYGSSSRSNFGAAAPAPFASRYGTTAGLYGDRSAYSRPAPAGGVPPPAGQEPTLRDRWQTSSSSASASADRLGGDSVYQQQAVPQYTSQYPGRDSWARDKPTQPQSAAPQPAAQSDSFSSRPSYCQQPSYVPRFAQADGCDSRWPSHASSASADRFGGRYMNRPSTAGPAIQQTSQRETPKTPQRTAYRPTTTTTTETAPPAIRAATPPPQKTKTELAADRQRKIESKRDQLARAAEGGPSETLALDMGGQCHGATTVVNAEPFAVDNSGRCHPSPVRARPTSSEPSHTKVPPYAVDNISRCHPSPPKLHEGAAQRPPPLPAAAVVSSAQDEINTALGSSECSTAASEVALSMGSAADSEALEDSGQDCLQVAEIGPGSLQDGECFCQESPFKGSVHVYRDEERVTIMSVHRDDVEPYFTIKMQDGREKQTVGSRLSQVIKCTAKPSTNSQPAAPEAAAPEAAAPEAAAPVPAAPAAPEAAAPVPAAPVYAPVYAPVPAAPVPAAPVPAAPVPLGVAPTSVYAPAPVEQQHEAAPKTTHAADAQRTVEPPAKQANMSDAHKQVTCHRQQFPNRMRLCDQPYSQPYSSDVRSNPNFNHRVEQEMAQIMAGGGTRGGAAYGGAAHATQQQQQADRSDAQPRYGLPPRSYEALHQPSAAPAAPAQQLAKIGVPGGMAARNGAEEPQSPGAAGLQLSEDRNTRIQQLSDHLAMLKKQRSALLNTM